MKKPASTKPPGMPSDELKSFTPVTDFVGYPFGEAHPIHFRAGIPSTPVPASYIASLSDKKTAAATAD